MKLIPAIDLINHRCVRLTKGDYNQEKVYSDDPVSMGKSFEDQGGDLLHVVDLEGAKKGQLVHGAEIRALRETLSIPIEVGGGIRDEQTIKELISWGVNRIILGTVLIKDPDFAIRILAKYPEHIVFGIDARVDAIAVRGWTETTDLKVIPTIKQFEEAGLKHVIYTDIERDGVLRGPNLDMIQSILDQTKVQLTASGGVGSLQDVNNLQQLWHNRLYGVIIGKALYEEKFQLTEARRLIDEATS